MTAFDVVAILIVAISVLVGFARGGVREIVTLVAFGAATVAALLALRYTAPPLRHLFHPAWVAGAAGVLLVFVLVYVVLRVFGGRLARFLHASNLGGADRTLGAGVGLLRALAVLGGFFLIYDKAMPKDLSPGWIVRGATWPVARASGRTLQKLAPGGGRLSSGVGRLMHDGVVSGFGAPKTNAVRDEGGGGVQLGGERTPTLDEAAPPDEATLPTGTERSAGSHDAAGGDSGEARRGLRVRLNDDHHHAPRHARHVDDRESSR